MKPNILVLTLMGVWLLDTGASATPMVEPGRTQVRADYKRGSFIQVKCEEVVNPCRVTLRIGGRSFSYGVEEFKGLEPDPRGEILFFGDANYFSFQVDVVCPEASQGEYPNFLCAVEVLVTDGKISTLTLERRVERSLPSQKWPPN
jgi:hypothetical protein